ncbi:MAG: lysozyme inhibitor LprI family protein [Pseudomonadota bacterium]|jgi:uncharacterized protein YecT (DUF1311 family)
MRRLWLTRLAMVFLLAPALPAALSASDLKDPTAETLDSCLNDAANASTAGQTGCEATASSDYDRRMNAAYATLMGKLPSKAAEQLRLSQRAWLAFRDSEAKARDALYATREGTMYVPMEASDATDIVRDRALQLEGYVRVMAIDE